MEKRLSIITVTHNRADLLRTRALQSLLSQTEQSFEWILVNDGRDFKTRELIDNLNSKFKIIYREIDHFSKNFGLCKGRNLGLELANNSLVTYLDDDNVLFPDLVSLMSNFMSSDPNIKFAIPLQKRKREVWHNKELVSQGKTFISPQENFSIDDFICHRELFDSNGFTHHRIESPDWNSNYRIYCDYEYFIQCLDLWGSRSFRTLSHPLVEYIQSNQGIIGQSNYGEWAEELMQIIDNQSKYPILSQSSEYLLFLKKLQNKFQLRHHQQVKIPAFKGG